MLEARMRGSQARPFFCLNLVLSQSIPTLHRPHADLDRDYPTLHARPLVYVPTSPARISPSCDAWKRDRCDAR